MWAEAMGEISVPYSQFFCEPKTTLRNPFLSP